MNDLGTFPFSEEVTPSKGSVKELLKKAKEVKEVKLPIGKMPRKPAEDTKTPLIYRGGKSAIATWVISHFPPHTVFVDVFGGGAAISLAKNPSTVDVYNDIGDVARFFEVIRNYGDEVYQFLTFYPFSREAFHYARRQKDIMEGTVFPSWDVAAYEEVNRYYKVRWAAYYYITILQSFRHEEDDGSWIVSKGVNLATSFASHVDSFPQIIDRLRRVTIEHKDALELIEQYDGPETLFYCDPPYLSTAKRSDIANYKHEMTVDQHLQLIRSLNNIKGQAVVSGYPSPLYDQNLISDNGWKRVEKVRQQGIKNTSQEGTEQKEVLWILESVNGLWTQANMAGVLSE